MRTKRAMIASHKRDASRGSPLSFGRKSGGLRMTDPLFLDPALVRARDAHVFAVFGYGAAGHLNALRLQDAGDLLVGQRASGIFFLDEFFDTAFEDQERCAAALRSLHALAEEISQLEYALWRVGIFVGHSTAYRGRMHADFFGHLLDHHGFELIDTPFEEVLLAGDDGVADLGDGLLALLDILDELDGALVTLFDVVARALFVAAVAGDELLVGRIEAELGQVFVIHDDQPLVPMLDECNVRLDQTSLDLVVTQARARIERPNVIEGSLYSLNRTANRLGDFFVLLTLKAAQVAVHDSNRILQNLYRAISILLLGKVNLVVAQLGKQTLA